MTRRVLSRARPWVGTVLVVGALGSFEPACDQRFEFDTQPGGAGAGGAPTTNGGRSTSGGISGVNDAGGEAASTVGGSTACGAVRECTAGTHCTGQECVQCVADGDCAVYGFPRCEPTRHRCVACLGTADCGRGFACDSLANRCLQSCLDDDSCPASAHGCDERRQVCYQCDEDRECINSAVGRLCATDGSGCVQCRKEADCAGMHCDQLTGRCVECRDGGDCSSQICNPTTFSCVPE